MLPFVLVMTGIMFLAAIVVIAVPFLDQGGAKVSVAGMLGREFIGIMFLAVAVIIGIILSNTFLLQ